MRSICAYSLVVVFLFSCTDTEEPILPAMLTGTWRMVEYEENQDVERVESFTFYENGTYGQWVEYREAGSGAFLGYQFYAGGTYELEGKRALIQESERLFQLGGTFYGELDQLSPINPNPEIWAELSLRENGTVLNMHLPCNPVSSALCVPNKTFNKLVAFSSDLL
ncbi:hypothetical protein [Cyclobacterium jeungdonense]|uniref:Lipocalin-like domain-containing protein n=1 Tax=Cyclobacterium jeungdonense TaxID=708087 RepID=A0ABT8CD32_9BACT|nr:hypothetical protein [Cyclobacterium jeungdonense]MDN3689596.1 hypothetical protein [Cyclobacterium jeungdonense]